MSERGRGVGRRDRLREAESKWQMRRSTSRARSSLNRQVQPKYGLDRQIDRLTNRKTGRQTDRYRYTNGGDEEGSEREVEGQTD